MIDSSNKLQWEITDAIYQTIFGKSRKQLMVASLPHWNTELVALHGGDTDEIIRDYMTIEALTALAHAEASVMLGISNQARAGLDFAVIEIADYCRQYRLQGKLWEFEG